ncbi:DEAD/DEAH box helicase family protein [Rhizobium leguminosarum]|uniref:helicase-related protein n=1 Tax=Rhizobium leguminosarum TaxID=384 RepID=UPI0012FB0EC5|nr:helicase-related protein [Rhizobium leguminosarum]MBY5746152.1 DEAD/DEAH box helicase family protein [Rhizobium leguminosarum]MVO97802.1 helicase [Rhizobium leguminosarum bv. phaseoli]
MTLLRDTAWRLKYTPDDGDLVRLFYVPALRSAVRYDRLTGYFSARALALAARGVEGLIVNNGRMRLIVGCTLGEEEVAAIERGESLRDTVERTLIKMPILSADPRTIDALELVAWMVANGFLDVKLAVPCDLDRKPIRDDSIFHEKTGIVEDKTGDRLAFNGSINETEFGWTRNWESFNAFTSWNDGPRVDEEEASFAKLWADRARRAITLDVPTALREQLLTFLPDPGRQPKRLTEHNDQTTGTTDRKLRTGADPKDEPVTSSSPPSVSVNEERQAIWEKIANAAIQPVGGDRVGEATSAVVPWPHQIRAYHRLYDNWPPKLLIADEVGLGKTVQAGLLLRQAWLSGRLKRALVLAPKNVCKQWQIELREKFNLNWPIYDGQKLTWYRSPARQHDYESPVSRLEWHREPFVIMSSHLARRQDRQREILEGADSYDLVVLDEAHHARTRGAGTPQAKGPNRLLQLMRSLRRRTNGLILLTATPLQVHASELWDLLDLLGLPAAWTSDAFVRFFSEVGKDPVTNESLDWLSVLFRANEAHFGELSRAVAERQTRLGGLKTRKVLQALRDPVSIPRRQLSPEERRAAISIMKRSTPVSALVSRHTRELLRNYFKAGKLATAVATRQVEDRFIPLSMEEGDIYSQVETYISDTYNAAAPDARNAVGFVMTIYRRRLASSFHALRQTMEKRKSGVGDLFTAADEARIDENVADQVEAGEEIDIETVSEDERRALAFEEIATIETIVNEIKRLPTDTKALELSKVLSELKGSGYPQVMVFTQFADTMDYLRELLAAAGSSVMCFSGRGGEIRNTDGTWTLISRDEVKRRFREGRSEVLVCTDAAAEGLNFQFCGALVNYDMPWNPMRVEQRIGRIDRLGQRFSDIRIINLHYEDTVEADVYRALRSRISIFEKVVGGLQPILTKLPRLIEESVLSKSADPAAKRDDALQALDTAIAAGEGSALNLDDFADEDLDVPARPDPAINLSDLRTILDRPILLPSGSEALHLNEKDYRFVDGFLPHAVRVTVDREFYEMHSDSVEFWTPGSPTFPDLDNYRT